MQEQSDQTSIPVPSEDSPWWPDGNEFALTFNAYDRVGDFETVAGIGNTAAKVFAEEGMLPPDLVALRTCLFFEQRRYRHLGVDPYRESRFALLPEGFAGEDPRVERGCCPGPRDPLP